MYICISPLPLGHMIRYRQMFSANFGKLKFCQRQWPKMFHCFMIFILYNYTHCDGKNFQGREQTESIFSVCQPLIRHAFIPQVYLITSQKQVCHNWSTQNIIADNLTYLKANYVCFFFCSGGCHLFGDVVLRNVLTIRSRPWVTKHWELLIFTFPPSCLFFLSIAALIPGPRWNPAALNIPLIDGHMLSAQWPTWLRYVRLTSASGATVLVLG